MTMMFYYYGRDGLASSHQLSLPFSSRFIFFPLLLFLRITNIYFDKNTANEECLSGMHVQIYLLNIVLILHNSV